MRALAIAALLAGGLATAGCRDLREARAAPTSAPLPPTTAEGRTLCADTARSVVRWKATKFAGRGKHEGVVRIASGHLVVRDSVVTGGSFTIDMTSIAVTDMPAHEVEARRQLRTHLKDEDFFAVERFPTARFVITGVAPRRGPGAFAVAGNLTIRDSTHNITFDASAPLVTPERVWASARLHIDRHEWGVSWVGTRLTRGPVDPLVELELLLVATAEADACGGGRGAGHASGPA